MKALRNLVAVLAMVSMAAFFTGCGDDDEEDNNNNNNNQGPQFAPVSVVAVTGNTYTVTLANGQTATLTFPSSTTYSFTPQGGAAETGQITGLNLQGEDWVGTFTPADNNGTARAGEIRLHFTGKTISAYAGTVTFQGANGPITVPFTATVNTGGTTAGGTTAGGTTAGGTTAGGTTAGGTTAGGTTAGGTTAGGTTAGGTTAGGTTAGGTTAGGAGLSGKTLQLSYVGGGGEKFAFTSDTNASYENGADTATAIYNTTTGQLNLTRGQGQIYSLVIAAGSNTGTTSVTYQQPGENAQTFQASYTLQ